MEDKGLSILSPNEANQSLLGSPFPFLAQDAVIALRASPGTMEAGSVTWPALVYEDERQGFSSAPTLLRDAMICLMTMRSAKTRTLVTEESSKRAAFTIPVLSLNTVTRPSG